jgi:hypothetical protein
VLIFWVADSNDTALITNSPEYGGSTFIRNVGIHLQVTRRYYLISKFYVVCYAFNMHEHHLCPVVRSVHSLFYGVTEVC